MRRRVLIIHPGSLGDVLLALPALRALRVRFPRHCHVLIAGGEVGRFLGSCAEIDELIPLEECVLTDLLAGARTPESIRKRVGDCDFVVGWMDDAEGALAATLQDLGVCRIILRSPAELEFDGYHQADRFLRILGDVVWQGDYQYGLCLDEADLAKGREILDRAGVPEKGVIGLHPGSGSRLKCCPASVFSEACSVLAAGGYFPILLGGPADVAPVADVIGHCAVPVPVFANQDLVTVAALLAHVDLYVGHDSGLTHLAAALHRPTIALFGPTPPQRWAPQGSHVRILTGGPCACATLTEIQACRPQPCLQLSAEHLASACTEMIPQRRLCDSVPPWRSMPPCSNR
jgi:heptosyltransferase-3